MKLNFINNENKMYHIQEIETSLSYRCCWGQCPVREYMPAYDVITVDHCYIHSHKMTNFTYKLITILLVINVD